MTIASSQMENLFCTDWKNIYSNIQTSMIISTVFYIWISIWPLHQVKWRIYYAFIGLKEHRFKHSNTLQKEHNLIHFLLENMVLEFFLRILCYYFETMKWFSKSQNVNIKPKMRKAMRKWISNEKMLISNQKWFSNVKMLISNQKWEKQWEHVIIFTLLIHFTVMWNLYCVQKRYLVQVLFLWLIIGLERKQS